eukprot:TRINITY_DN6175_c0_g1_i6.p1 TRINITY_DN6175_c0_g1~~TRINITY_DN6175_c0_g1_i6.p1  ORF type:complete len:172 (-),score=30.82 TRINITY_DN6175_c0_g1_i6:93-608(-)
MEQQHALVVRDAPLHYCSERAKRQAAYIESTGADIVHLQEVFTKRQLQRLEALLPVYRSHWVDRSPPVSGQLAYLVLVGMVSWVQMMVISMTGLVDPMPLWFGLGVLLLWRWRDSVPAGFCCGRTGIPMATMVRKGLPDMYTAVKHFTDRLNTMSLCVTLFRLGVLGPGGN